MIRPQHPVPQIGDAEEVPESFDEALGGIACLVLNGADPGDGCVGIELAKLLRATGKRVLVDLTRFSHFFAPATSSLRTSAGPSTGHCQPRHTKRALGEPRSAMLRGSPIAR